jgi:hypothetical protein
VKQSKARLHLPQQSRCFTTLLLAACWLQGPTRLVAVVQQQRQGPQQ